MALNQLLFDQRLAALRAVPGLSPTAVDPLVALLQDPDDWSCFRINPRSFADRHGMTQPSALDLFLHATRAGLLDLRFNLICPGCGGVEYQLERMDAVPSREWHCVVCQRQVQADLDDRVEVNFSVEQGVRDLQLNVFTGVANYTRFFFSNNFLRAPELEKFVRSISVGVFLVQPGGDVSLTIDADPKKTYRLLSLDTHSQVLFPPAPANTGVDRVEITALAEGLGPKEVPLAPGPVAIRVVNRGTAPVGFMALEVDWETLARILEEHPNQMRPFLTAKMLLNNQTFRDLFRVQTLNANMQLRLRSLTLLFTDLKGSTELYDRTGDIRAYTFVREHFKVLTEAVKRNHGAIIKTMGDAIMASFNEPTDAASAALQMMHGMEALNAGLKAEGHDTGLKVGLHEGSALAVTSDERLDYFGQTVNVAARVQGLAQAGEIWLTPSVMDAPGVQQSLREGGWRGEEQQVSLKGVGGKTRVYRMHR